MKKYIILLICCVMIGLTGCSSKKLIGYWEVTKIYINGQKQNINDSFPVENSLMSKMIFESDGKGYVFGQEFYWKQEDDEIEIRIDGEYLEAELKGSKLKYYPEEKNKKTYVVFEKVEIDDVAEESKEKFVGTWKSNMYCSKNINYKLEEIGLKESKVKLTIEEDGTGTLGGDSFTWKSYSNLIRFSIDGDDYIAEFTGETLRLYLEDDLNSYFIYTKK